MQFAGALCWVSVQTGDICQKEYYFLILMNCFLGNLHDYSFYIQTRVVCFLFAKKKTYKNDDVINLKMPGAHK